jgi:hypothetical protein
LSKVGEAELARTMLNCNEAAENGELTLEDAQHLKLTCSAELT